MLYYIMLYYVIIYYVGGRQSGVLRRGGPASRLVCSSWSLCPWP